MVSRINSRRSNDDHDHQTQEQQNQQKQYKLTKRLGQGMFATVYEAETVSAAGRTERCAVKVMTRENPAEMQAKVQYWKNEVRALANCPPNDHIISLHGFCESGTLRLKAESNEFEQPVIFSVLELAKVCTLFDCM